MAKSLSPNRIGNNIKSLREDKKLSQTDLAKRSRVSLNTIVFLENGRSKNPTIKTLVKIAAGLRVGVDDLLQKNR